MGPSFALVMLAACAPSNNAVTVGDASPPPPYALQLRSELWVVGQATRVEVRGATPGAPVQLILGDPGQSCPRALGGACTDIAAPVVLITRARANAGGIVVFHVLVRAAAPVGRRARIQAFSDLGAAVSSSNPWDLRFLAPQVPAANLLVNGTADTTFVPWLPQTNVIEVDWSPHDRLGDPASGALRITNVAVNTHSSTWQCVDVLPGETYDLDGWGLLPNAAAGAYLFGEYIFYANPGCTGALVGFDESPWENAVGVWTRIPMAAIPTPAGALSLRVGHGLIDFQLGNTVAFLDDLSLVRR